MKRVEKSVYERVEQEYANILAEKDSHISMLSQQIVDLQLEISNLKD